MSRPEAAPVRLAGRVGLVLMGVSFALGAVEVGVRAVLPQPLGAGDPPPLLRGMLTEPGDHRVRTAEYDVVAHVNGAGFVDREWGPKAGPRVVVIGDSFVQAAQVPLDEGYGRVLAREAGVEVLSLGVPGAGTATALDVLEAYAFPLHPDLVLLGFLVANDVLNNDPLLDTKTDKPFYALRDGRLVRTDPVLASAPLPWLWERSDTFRWVARTWAARREAEARVAAGEGGVPVDLEVYLAGGDARWEEAWTVTDALVGAMADRCAAAGVGFGTVLFPDQVQATATGRARAEARWPSLRGWHPEAAQARALALAERHGPALDLLPALAAAPGTLYFADDGHWTAEGHRVAATATAPWVRGLLEAGGR